MSNSHESEYNQNDHLPLNADASRAPQLNPKVLGHGGTSCEDIGMGEDDNGDAGDTNVDFISDLASLYQDFYEEDGGANDDDVAELVFGQEGVEEGQAGTPGCSCSCHQPVWTRHPLLNTSPPSCSGMHSVSSSVRAEYDGSGDRSGENSTILSSASPSPSGHDVVSGTLCIDERVFDSLHYLRFSLVHNPLPLLPQLGFA